MTSNDWITLSSVQDRFKDFKTFEGINIHSWTALTDALVRIDGNVYPNKVEGVHRFLNILMGSPVWQSMAEKYTVEAIQKLGKLK